MPTRGRARTLPQVWAQAWSEEPHRAVLRGPDAVWWTRARLDEESSVVAGRLQAAGLAQGDRVLISAEPSERLVAVYVGLLRAGLVAVPVHTAYGAEELRRIVVDADPSAVVLDDPQRRAWCTGAAPRSPLALSLEIELDDAPPQALDVAGPGGPALLLYTSGTTGAPKGAMLSHGNLHAGAAALRKAWQWQPDDRLVHALPLFHLHGLGIALNGTLLSGASAVLVGPFDVDRVVDAAVAENATLFFGVPTMYRRLAASTRFPELKRLRLLVSGSAPLPVDLFEEIAAATGHCPVERYGLTETVINTSNPVDGERRAGSVGRPLPDVELRLAGDGEVMVRGPNVFGGYWRDASATAAAFHDGWFKTGDLGEMSDDGYLRLVGRSKDVIITGGYNVHPVEVEDVLRRHPAVEEAAVVGSPDRDWGEAVVAFVVAASSVAPQELARHAAATLAPYKRPKRYHFIDEVPRNALGKIQRHLLRE